MLIGEVAERSGISARMLRHYDRLGLVSPTGRSLGGYRQYSEDDLHRLFQVEGLRLLGLSLQEIGETLQDLSFDPSSMVEQLVARTRERLAREQELLRRLEQVAASTPEAWTDVLRLTALMRGLDASSPSERQRFALTMGGEDGGDAALLAEAVLGEDDPIVAATLSWALARTGDDAVPILADALGSEESTRRHRAVEALSKIGTPRADEALAEALDHPDPVVRARASLAGGRIGRPDAIPGLVGLIVEGQDDVDATDVLARLATEYDCAEQAALALSDALTAAGPAGRQRLAIALAEVSDPAARAALIALLDDAEPQVALTARFLLHGSGS
ncbi:MAG: HEAT repeat domain-containing protein [Arachnia sp.]